MNCYSILEKRNSCRCSFLYLLPTIQVLITWLLYCIYYSRPLRALCGWYTNTFGCQGVLRSYYSLHVCSKRCHGFCVWCKLPGFTKLCSFSSSPNWDFVWLLNQKSLPYIPGFDTEVGGGGVHWNFSLLVRVPTQKCKNYDVIIVSTAAIGYTT